MNKSEKEELKNIKLRFEQAMTEINFHNYKIAGSFIELGIKETDALIAGEDK